MLSGLGSTIMQGMAFGTGSAIAHRAVGAAAGALSGGGSDNSSQHEQVQHQDQTVAQTNMGACHYDMTAFNQVNVSLLQLAISS